MARQARIVVPGVPHHITQRGNNGQATFFLPDDRRAYLEFLLEACEAHRLRVHAYCLMPNHVHLVATPPAEPSLAETTEQVNTNYVKYVNDRYRRTGHL